MIRLKTWKLSLTISYDLYICLGIETYIPGIFEPRHVISNIVSFYECILRRSCAATFLMGVQWLSGRVLDTKQKGRGFEPHRRHCVVSLSRNINPSLVLVRPRKTRLYITERLLMGRKESNQMKQKKPPFKLTNSK